VNYRKLVNIGLVPGCNVHRHYQGKADRLAIAAMRQWWLVLPEDWRFAIDG